MKTNNRKRGRRLPESIMAAAAILSVILLPSCYDNKGTSSEDYVELSELRIDTVDMGIRPSYSLRQSEDPLEIAPEIYYKGQAVTLENAADMPLEFSWVLYTPASSATGSTRVDTLSVTPAVNSVISRGAGSYTCLFTVTDQETGIQDYCSFAVTVTSNITDGYLILYETADGNTDVGLIINDWINLSSTADRMMVDIFSGTNGAPMAGKPVSIRHSERTVLSGEVLIASESELTGVNYSEFEVTYSMQAQGSEIASLFNEAPEALDIAYMGIGGNPGWSGTTQVREYLISDNKLYYTTRGNTSISRPTHTKFGQPLGGAYGVLAPWCAMLVNTNVYEAVVYDQSNTCFRHVAYNSGTEILPFSKEATGLNPAFDITDTGMQMVASDWGYRFVGPVANASQFYEFSLMRSGSNRSILVTSWGAAIVTATSLKAAANYNLSGYPGIENATMLAAGAAGPVLYYSDGSAVWLLIHDVPTRTISAASDFWTPPAGEEVTAMRVHKNASLMKTHPALASGYFTHDNQILYVATWNEGTQTGTVYQINVNATNGSRVGDDEGIRVYSGFGKIKDMCWKWPV